MMIPKNAICSITGEKEEVRRVLDVMSAYVEGHAEKVSPFFHVCMKRDMLD